MLRFVSAHRFKILLALVLMLPGMVMAETSLRPFVADSLKEIKQAQAGKPFLLMFWSLDCASCMKEMDALARTVEKNPGLNLVMISTDEDSYSQQVQAMLAKHKLLGVENWIFSGADAQRLRYEIDPVWFGELPRSYFYDAAHNRLPHSGALTEEHIAAWLAAVKAK